MLQTLSNTTYQVGHQGLNLVYNADYTLRAMYSDSLMMSLFETPVGEQAIANLFLRIADNEGYSVTPLLFFNNEIETFLLADGTLCWRTQTAQFDATVRVHVSENAYFYDVAVTNKAPDALQIDVIYGQDLAMADAGAVKTNEAYCCQYLDHQVFLLAETGYVVCSRQNLPQSSGNPAIQLGAFSPVQSFSTDGYQFFGTEYKITGEARALQAPQLANEKYQYEMAYIALQSTPTSVASGHTHAVTFYGVVNAHCPEANVRAPQSVDTIRALHTASAIDWETATLLPALAKEKAKPIVGESLSETEISTFFGDDRRFDEHKNGELLSFFYGDSQYVTLQAKEKYLERATGHVIASGNNTDYRNPIMSATHHIFGVFNSQLTLGNTSFNKLLGVCRNALNQYTHSGQRIWIREGEAYRPLGMPSAYEVGTNYSRWIYKYRDGFLNICAFSSAEQPVIQLDIHSQGINETLDIAVSHQLIYGNNEQESGITVAQGRNGFIVTGDNGLIAERASDLYFSIMPCENLSEHSVITHSETGAVEYLVLKGQLRDTASISMGGQLGSVNTEGVTLDFATEAKNAYQVQQSLMKGFNVHFSKDEENSQKLNETLHWFTHNALVHYSTPHGLEQYSGAAWGTRDVSQGPFELFMAMQQFDRAEALIHEIYRHQYIETGTWPQWFMFDQYAAIQQEESHGDIVVWPLKALADYITVTGNVAILATPLPYTSVEGQFAFTTETYTLFEHVKRQLQHIYDNLLPGTSLSCYGDGDWDDTLQPANQSLRENMVSGWTIPLTLQALKTMGRALESHADYSTFSRELFTLAENMEQDYHHYLIKDEVIAGFIHFDRDDNGDVLGIEHLLHPSDNKTGISYRLLPASRSIISETFSLEMAQQHMALIKAHLVHPDGVRLMDRMAEYKAGKQTYFKRAELAANLGREVGLQYCHAHIRFIEALCKLGDAEAVYENLYKILPVGIQSAVPNAELRQANAYFSSSDAKFNDRNEAYARFDDVKAGKVAVKGGWRIYSSGPGIYINQLVASVLGVRFDNTDLVIDPVVAHSLGTVTLTFELDQRPIKVVIEPETGEHTPKTMQLNGQPVPFVLTPNRYRTGGARINASWLNKALQEGDNTLVVKL
ncbi:cellobiose phosphorylase [Photobacterium japonica]|uniref:GH36-type glycosyl hydrolase domain-containing protein n=1 Tax=Photobacterium japonica TaxID=2910235 RepID=UPI003D14BDDD